MNIQTVMNGRKIYVSLTGEFDYFSEQELVRQMRFWLSHDFTDTVFDMSNVSGLSRSTIGKLMMFYQNATAKGRNMRIVGLKSTVVPRLPDLEIHQLLPVETA